MVTETRRIERAMTCVDDECSVLQSEREAFRELREHLRSIRPVSSTGGGTLVTQTVVQDRESTAEFVDAYQKTVMGVDHYESHYGESVGENMAMELGAEIATAIQANAELNPLLHRKLQVAIEEAIQRRFRLLDILDDERICLRTALKDYRRVERRIDEMADCRASAAPFEELERRWNRLSDLEERCEQSIRSRQQYITERRTSALEFDDHVTFNDYLYETLESRFPVLKTGLELLDRIDRHR